MNIKTKQRFNTLSPLLRIMAVVLPLALSLAIAVTSLAYGPERTTFTIEKPATYNTFNSITNNPNYGDERNFVIAKDAANTGSGGWSADELKVQDGKEYLVRMYVHNNAGDKHNLAARNTRVSANVPNTYAKSHQIDGYITADNAKPNKIWDSVVLKGDKEFIASFVGGSARYYNNVNPNPGFTLPDSIVTKSGAKVGYESMNGTVPGCFKYSGIATFRVKVTTRKAADFSVSKKVRIAGTEEWKDSINAKVGDKLEYRVGYDNVGKTVQNNVIMRDAPAKGIAFEKGSSTLKNATNPKGNGKAIGNDSLVTEKGVNIGNYTPNSNAFVYYSATVKKEDLKCGENRLINTATASTDNGRKSDTAEVLVTTKCKKNECKPGIPEGDERCESSPTPPATPTTPGELPTTGPAEVIVGILGIALLSLGVAYWMRSRNAYKKAVTGFSEEFTAAPQEHLLEAKNETEDSKVSETTSADDTHADRFHKK